jgi:hypothetical protein
VSKVAWFHLVSTVAWLPATGLIFLLGLQNAVWVVFILSIYNNLKTDWASFHAARASESSD